MDTLDKLIACESLTYMQMIEIVSALIIKDLLLTHHGNMTRVAERLDCSRTTVRKFAHSNADQHQALTNTPPAQIAEWNSKLKELL